MNYLKGTLYLIMMAMPFSTYASKDCVLPTTTVPFQDITLAPNCNFTANYDFGPHAIIFCFTSEQPNIGSITWTYQGGLPSGPLPISLKTNKDFQGEFADPSGHLNIQNQSNVTFQVSCLFGF